MTFSKHMEEQVNKANRMTDLTRSTYQFLKMKSIKMFFTALVWPYLEFGNVALALHFQKDRQLIEVS